jgi:hypothetical protein
VNNRNLNYFLYFFWHFSDNFYWNLNLFYYLYDFLLYYYFFLYSFNFFYLLNYFLYSHNFFDNLWDLDNSLYCLIDDDWFLHDSINYLITNLNMIVNLLCSYYFDLRYNFFYNFLNFDYFWNLYFLLDNFLYNNWNLSDYLSYFLGGNYFFNN